VAPCGLAMVLPLKRHCGARLRMARCRYQAWWRSARWAPAEPCPYPSEGVSRRCHVRNVRPTAASSHRAAASRTAPYRRPGRAPAADGSGPAPRGGRNCSPNTPATPCRSWSTSETSSSPPSPTCRRFPLVGCITGSWAGRGAPSSEPDPTEGTPRRPGPFARRRFRRRRLRRGWRDECAPARRRDHALPRWLALLDTARSGRRPGSLGSGGPRTPAATPGAARWRTPGTPPAWCKPG
jgi:hypothetical protein